MDIKKFVDLIDLIDLVYKACLSYLIFYIVVKFSFSKKATKFETIFHLI